MRAAVVDGDGLVVNVIEYDPEADYDPGEGLTVRELPDDSPVGIGHRRAGNGKFVAPEPPAEADQPETE